MIFFMFTIFLIRRIASDIIYPQDRYHAGSFTAGISYFKASALEYIIFQAKDNEEQNHYYQNKPQNVILERSEAE